MNFTVPCFTLLLALLAPAHTLADDLPKPIEKARDKIDAEYKQITWFAHHYSDKHDKDFNGARKIQGGYILSFTFRFVNPVGFKHRTKMEFVVDNAGVVSSVAVVDYTTLKEPFGDDLTKDDVEMRRKDMRKHPKVKDSVKLLAVVDKADVKDLCLLYINLDTDK